MSDSAASGRALRGGVVRSGTYAAGLLLSLVSAPLLVRHLGVVDFGKYVTVGSVLAVVLGLTEAGLNTIALREYATRAGRSRDQLMRDALSTRLALTLAGVALAVAFSIAAGYGSVFVIGVAVAGGGLTLQSMQSILSVPLQSELKLGRAALADLLRQVVSVSLIVFLVISGGGLISFFAVSIPASAASLAFTAIAARGLTPLRPALLPRASWPLLRESVPYAAAIALNVVYFRIAVVVTSLLASPLQTGYFATSFRVMEVLIGVPALAIGAAFPLLARAESIDRIRFVRGSKRLVELAVYAGVWLAVTIEVSAPLVMRIVAGAAGAPAVSVLRIQGLALVATFVNIACAYPLLALRRYRDLLFSNLVALMVSIALLVLLVGPIGARGAAIAATAGEAGLATTVALLLARRLPEVRLPLMSLAAALGAGASAVVIAILMPVGPLLQIAVAVTAYGVLLRLAGRFPPEAWALLRGLRWPRPRFSAW